jgi:hypothetical protein
MANQVIEIARREGTEYRRVDLMLKDDGAIVLEGQDIGNPLRIIAIRCSPQPRNPKIRR